MEPGCASGSVGTVGVPTPGCLSQSGVFWGQVNYVTFSGSHNKYCAGKTNGGTSNQYCAAATNHSSCLKQSEGPAPRFIPVMFDMGVGMAFPHQLMKVGDINIASCNSWEDLGAQVYLLFLEYPAAGIPFAPDHWTELSIWPGRIALFDDMNGVAEYEFGLSPWAAAKDGVRRCRLLPLDDEDDDEDDVDVEGAADDPDSPVSCASTSIWSMSL